MKQIRVSDEVHEYIKGMVEDAAVENDGTDAEKITFSEAIGRLIEDREAMQ